MAGAAAMTGECWRRGCGCPPLTPIRDYRCARCGTPLRRDPIREAAQREAANAPPFTPEKMASLRTLLTSRKGETAIDS